jgi:hypothetical protein
MGTGALSSEVRRTGRKVNRSPPFSGKGEGRREPYLHKSMTLLVANHFPIPNL